MSILDLISNKRQIELGSTLNGKGLSVGGYDKTENKVFLQEEVGAEFIKRKVYTSSKGYYINYKGRRVYLRVRTLKEEKVNKSIKCPFQTRIKISSFISEDPTKEELLFMYEWLYNSNIRKGDIERAKELEKKYNKIKHSENVRTYKIKGGIPILAGGVASQIPSINYTKTEKGINYIPFTNNLNYNELAGIYKEVIGGELQ